MLKIHLAMISQLTALGLGAVLAVSSGPVAAQALEILNPPIKVSAKAKSGKKAKRGNNAKFMPGSQETVKQRESRLYRECKGAVNAGACSGYTR